MSDHKKILRALVVSAFLTLVLFLLPSFLSGDQIILFTLQIIISLLVMFINRDIFINGIRSLFSRTPNVDALFSIGVIAAFIYSIVVSVINIIY